MSQLDTGTVPSPCHRGRQCSYKDGYILIQTFPQDSLEWVFRQERLLSQHGTTKAEHKPAAKGKERLSWVDPPTLIAVLSVTTQRAFSLAFSSHMVTGNSFWTGTLLLTAGSISTRVTFYRQNRKEGRKAQILLVGGLVSMSWPTQFASEQIFFSLILFSF